MDQELGLYFRGVPANIPAWVLILEAANMDPIRAAEIEEKATERWWKRYMRYRKKKNEAEKKSIDGSTA